MSVLEEVTSLVLDLNRDIQALVFFLRSPPRTDVNEKFVALAQTATADFRSLQAKAAEANAAYPDADTAVMSLELTIEAIQSFLVASIKQMRDCLRECLEPQSEFSSGPSLAFLSNITTSMSNLVESVVSSTKSIKKISEGSMKMPAPIVPSSQQTQYLDVAPLQAHEVNKLFSPTSPRDLNSYFGQSTPAHTRTTQGSASNDTSNHNGPNSPSFESLLAEFEKKERKEARLARKRADTAMKQSLKRAGIHIDSETLDAIILQLSEIAAVFLCESNNFGQRPDGSVDLHTSMDELGTKRPKIEEHVLALRNASTAMESFLTKHDQMSLAKMTRLHMSDVMMTLNQVLSEAPHVSWDSLHQLDVAIKDFAGTIRDVVQLSNPEYEDVVAFEIEDDDDPADEPPPIVKPTRLLTKEEELMLAFDGFSDALDALDVSLTPVAGVSSPASSFSSASALSTNGLSSTSGLDSYGMNSSSTRFSRDSTADPYAKSGASSEYASGSYSSSISFISSSPIVSKPSTNSAPSSFSLPNLKAVAAGSAVASAASLNSPTSSSSSSRSPRDTDRVTLSFAIARPSVLVLTPSAVESGLNDAEEAVSKSTKPRLTATRSIPSIESTFEIADEAVRQADLAKMADKWSEMQARSEEQRTIGDTAPDGTKHDTTSWEASKVKAALKFMSKKVGDIRKAVGGSGSVSSGSSHSRLSSSSSSIPSPGSSPGANGSAASPGVGSGVKRRTMIMATGGPSSSSTDSPSGKRRSGQLSNLASDDPRCFLFEEPDEDAVLRVSPDGSVVAGTLEKLVQRLTHDSMSDPDYVLQFLTTYKCFTTSAELLELLILRWDTAAPPHTDPAIFESTRLPSIRLRVYNVLKTWLEKFWSDLTESETLERLKAFTARMYHGGMSSASGTLTKIIQKNLENLAPEMQLPTPPVVHDFVRRSRRETPIALPSIQKSGSETNVSGDSQTPRSQGTMVPAILTVNVKLLSRPLSILDFHPAELARQISRIEFELWKQVKNVELLEVAWTKKDKETRAPNVLNMIRFSNHLTNWIISEILAPTDPVERSVVLNRCLWTAKYLVELSNFNGAMEALSAFHSSAIYRLKNTWNCLPSTTWNILDSLEKLMSPDANFKTYRSEYERAVPPYMPYLGTHLSDLLFLEETIPRFVDGGASQRPLINFAKMEKMAQFIQTLELSQQFPYSVTPVPIIISYIKDYPVLDQKDAYNKSLECEARAKKSRPVSTMIQSPQKQQPSGQNPSSPSQTRPVTVIGTDSSSSGYKPTTPRDTPSGSF